MKKTAHLLLTLAVVALCASCRTTVPGPAYILHISSTGPAPVPLAVIGTMTLEWDPDPAPDVRFDPVPNSIADGGAMISSAADGHFLVTYTGDQIRAIGMQTTTGFDVRLPFYSTDLSMGQDVYHVLVTIHVLNAAGTEIAKGAANVPWPLDEHITTQSPQSVPVMCLPMMAAACAGM